MAETEVNQGSTLSFHRQIFAELLEQDGLLVLGKGLGLQDIIVKFLQLYGSYSSNKPLTRRRASSSKAESTGEDDSSKPPLVLIINARNEAQHLRHSLLTAGVVESELPRVVDSTIPVETRIRMFEQGGCYFVTTVILVVDLLKKRLDPTSIAGFLVLNAESITESSSEALILKIYRQANFIGGGKMQRTVPRSRNTTGRMFNGFVKAFSENPESLSSGFGKLAQILKNVGVRKVYLWPRFHAAVKECLTRKSPEVLEISQPLTPAMEVIQNAIVEATTSCLSELRKTANIDVSDFNVESSLFRSFDVTLRRQLDPLWHKIGYKSKQLVSDLGVLRRLLPDLLRFDCVSFYTILQSIQRENQGLLSPALWLLTEAADKLFKAAKERMYRVVPVRELAKVSPVEAKHIVDHNLFHLDSGVEKCLQVNLEDNPKWELLREVLDEIREEVKRAPSKLVTGCDILVLCNDARTSRQLQLYLHSFGHEVRVKEGELGAGNANKSSSEDQQENPFGESSLLVQERFKMFLEKHAINCLNLQSRTRVETEKDSPSNRFTSREEWNKQNYSKKKATGSEKSNQSKQTEQTVPFGVAGSIKRQESKIRERFDANFNIDHSRKERERIILKGIRDLKYTRNWRNLPPVKARLNAARVPLVHTNGYQLSAEQKLLLTFYESIVKRDEASSTNTVDASTRRVNRNEKRFQIMDRAHVVIQTRRSKSAVSASLAELCPRFVVLFDPSISAVREVEIHQAKNPDEQIRVYFLLYQNSVEEQRYLAELKREQSAFKKLIEEKSNLVLPELMGGIVNSANADSEQFAQTIIGYNISTGEPILSNGKTGKQVASGTDGDGPPRVVVDMREFRSALPILLHREGVNIDPITLEVGDYIITPDQCLERKSISDLFSSFNSGRLYKQSEAMSRYYKQPGLLIEFDENRPFSLQSVASIDNDVTMKSIVSKLVLLTLHFPEMRLFWSPKPRATVKLFKMLKVNYKNPDAEKAAVVGVPQANMNDSASIGEKRKLSGEVEAPTGLGNTIAQDVLRRLPGVTIHTIYPLMEKGKTLRGLSNLTLKELQEIMGAIKGEQLYKFLRYAPTEKGR